MPFDPQDFYNRNKDKLPHQISDEDRKAAQAWIDAENKKDAASGHGFGGVGDPDVIKRQISGEEPVNVPQWPLIAASAGIPELGIASRAASGALMLPRILGNLGFDLPTIARIMKVAGPAASIAGHTAEGAAGGAIGGAIEGDPVTGALAGGALRGAGTTAGMIGRGISQLPWWARKAANIPLAAGIAHAMAQTPLGYGSYLATWPLAHGHLTEVAADWANRLSRKVPPAAVGAATAAATKDDENGR